MKKNSRDSNNTIIVKDNAYVGTFGNDEANIYTHAVFCQCILPIRSLPKGTNHYEIKHGNASLMIQSGVMWDEKGKAVQMEVPSGAKARLLLPYIIDQATRTGNPEVNMGANLYQFMQQNNIKIGGANRQELQRQVNNIAASSINLGIWGETETHRYNTQESYRIASKVSFWTEKEANQLTFWNPTLVISDEFMATLSNHMVLLDIKPLIELQDKPRSMDMYMWLSYRIRNVKHAVKISYSDLHSIFGAQTKALGDFKRDFKTAVEQAIPYISDADIDFDSDKKHLILRNNKNKLYIPGAITKNENIPESGVFGELKAIGLPVDRIKQLTKDNAPEKIKKALDVTKKAIDKGKVKNPAGFFTKAVQQGWEFTEDKAEKETADNEVKFDKSFENSITDKEWKKVRTHLNKKHGTAKFNAWLKDLELLEKGREVTLQAKTRFIKQTIENEFLSDLTKFWQEVNKSVEKVKIVIK